ncbi:MAG: acyl transferase [Oligoflexia bacterium]|nr:acyl transferase [Oligoflexia bacterium]
MSLPKQHPPKMALLMMGFPSVLATMILLEILAWSTSPAWYHPLVFLFLIYGFPLICYRIHSLFFPLVEERKIFPDGKYTVWLGTYHLQLIYLTFPFLEGFLRMIPGVFALWLRLWGSKVGSQVIFAPQIEIADRGLLEIGDNCVLAHRTGYYCHVMTPGPDGRLVLMVKKIKIGNRCFIGAASRIGPGTVIEDGTILPAGTDVYKRGQVQAKSL